MISVRMWVVAMTIMRTALASGEKGRENERKRAAMRLMWILGRRPVIMPMIIPRGMRKRGSYMLVFLVEPGRFCNFYSDCEI